jgi:hypothetical protein
MPGPRKLRNVTTGVRAENAQTQCLIDASNAACAARRGEKRDLLSRLTDPPRPKGIHAGTSETTRRYLPKLTDKERKLLNEHEGCTRCRKPYAGHRATNCEMTINNAWPNAETYIPLTLEMALASKAQNTASSSRLPAAAAISNQNEARNDKTDSYVNSPFTIPHLVTTLDAFGPNISEFSLSLPALLDIGCPSIVISSATVDELGLRRYPLPPEEDILHHNPIRHFLVRNM